MGKKLITIRQAMTHLNVTESLIMNLIKAGTLHSYKKGNTIKIDENEMNEWISGLGDSETKRLYKNKNKKKFSDFFKPSYIILDFKADNKFEAISELAKKARSLNLVKDHRWLYDVLIAREELASTATEHGVAFVHPRHPHPAKVKKPAIIFGRSKKEIDFGAINKKPVKIYFLLLLHDDVQHLFSISYISKCILDEHNLEILKTAKSAHEISELLLGTH
jgi:PTS system nitrogen regulatory IIA component